jgi:hypothetical protein
MITEFNIIHPTINFTIEKLRKQTKFSWPDHTSRT